jgi:hypothetical protein
MYEQAALQLPYDYDDGGPDEATKGVSDLPAARLIAGVPADADNRTVRRALLGLIRPALKAVNAFTARGAVAGLGSADAVQEYWYGWSLLSWYYRAKGILNGDDELGQLRRLYPSVPAGVRRAQLLDRVQTMLGHNGLAQAVRTALEGPLPMRTRSSRPTWQPRQRQPRRPQLLLKLLTRPRRQQRRHRRRRRGRQHRPLLGPPRPPRPSAASSPRCPRARQTRAEMISPPSTASRRAGRGPREAAAAHDGGRAHGLQPYAELEAGGG